MPSSRKFLQTMKAFSLVGRAWNQDCNGEPLLFSKDRQDCSVHIGCNLELLSVPENFLPDCKLPAVILTLNLSAQLIGEPLTRNWCGWHKE